MRHVDDGTLNAWLDEQLDDAPERASIGAHLATCGSCRARLEQERSTRSQAISLLAAAAPAGLERPPFEQLVARASGGTSAAGRARRGWWVPATWAASIALALGLGWAAREVALQTVTRGEERRPSAAVPSAVATDVEPIDAPADVAFSAPPSPHAADPSPAAVAGGETAAVAASRPRAAGASTAAARDNRDERQVVAAERVVVEPVPAERGAMMQAQSAPGAPPPPQLPLAERGADAPAGAVVTTVEHWLAMPRTEAAARSGMPLFGLPGVEPLSTALSGDSAAVRTRYLIAGDTIELVQQRIAEPALPSAPEATQRSSDAATARRHALTMEAPVRDQPVHSVLVERDVRVTLRGGASVATLAQLAGQLRVE
jgi:hypothetical protein